MQMYNKKHVVYGSIAFIWIAASTVEITISAAFTDIVDATCIWIPAYLSHVSKTAMIIFNRIFMYFLPLTVMVFCYARVVHALRTKVSCK